MYAYHGADELALATATSHPVGLFTFVPWKETDSLKPPPVHEAMGRRAHATRRGGNSRCHRHGRQVRRLRPPDPIGDRYLAARDHALVEARPSLGPRRLGPPIDVERPRLAVRAMGRRGQGNPRRGAHRRMKIDPCGVATTPQRPW